ncbi:hypothetical protein GCM10009554_04960 [Kribbella koreensis]|uniref:Uncharacterized protein n=1 Tax=Kribbella koreensis TaxID=57909 RepID=A0ABN1PAT6_9ACTN
MNYEWVDFGKSYPDHDYLMTGRLADRCPQKTRAAQIGSLRLGDRGIVLSQAEEGSSRRHKLRPDFSARRSGASRRMHQRPDSGWEQALSGARHGLSLLSALGGCIGQAGGEER